MSTNVILTNQAGIAPMLMATGSKELAAPSGAPYVSVNPFYLYIGTGGDLKCKLQGDAAYATFKNISDGTIFPGAIKEISEDSTVSDLVIIE